MPPQRTLPSRKPGRPIASRVFESGAEGSGDPHKTIGSSSRASKTARRKPRPKPSARLTMPSSLTSSNAPTAAGQGSTATPKRPRSTSSPKMKAQETIDHQGNDTVSVVPLNENEMTEFPFPPQDAASTPSLGPLHRPSTFTPSFTFPEGHEHTPSTQITTLLSNWNAFTPPPASGEFDSHPDLHSLVSPEPLPLSDLIREELIDTSPPQHPATQTSGKLSPLPHPGFAGLRLTPSDDEEDRILNAPRATSPYSPAYLPGRSLFSPSRSISSTDSRPAPPIPQRQLSWSQTASALQAQVQLGRRFSVGDDREIRGAQRKGSYTDPRNPSAHPLSKSLPPQRQESLPSSGIDHPKLDDVFAPQYQLAGFGSPPLPSGTTIRPFRLPLPSPPATLATVKGRVDKSTFGVTLGQSGVRLTSETAMRYLTDHHLPAQFTARYSLRDELGVGGFGFVCSALVIEEPAPHTGFSNVASLGTEVAVKFIFKDKMGRSGRDMINGWPVEAWVLKRCRHQGIIGFHELFEDEKFFYLVQELHGDPWDLGHTLECPKDVAAQAVSVPNTPFTQPQLSPFGPLTLSPLPLSPSPLPGVSPSAIGYDPDGSPTLARRPLMGRRASHDLFEAVERQRFSENQARNIFKQIVEAIAYLHQRHIYHRDLKDENIVIDRNLQIKIVDFGSAVVENTKCPPILYDQFRGTLAYAAAEVLRGDSYHAGPADIWSLGILLSILFTGESPFPDSSHARQGKIKTKQPMPPGALDLMKRCLVPKPEFRITVQGVREHYWLAATPRKPLRLLRL